MIKYLIIFCFVLIVSIIAKKHDDKHWLDHKSRYELNFNDDIEHTNAYENFKSADKIINKHNSDNKQTYKLSHSQFSHLINIF